ADASELESAKSKIDSIYGSIKAPVNNAHTVGGGGDYMPSGESGGGKKGSSGSGKSEEAEAKKAQQEAIKAEKDALKEITDAYDKSKNTISNDLKEIELNEKMLGKATNDNFPQRVDLTNKKIKEQQSLLDSSTNQLMDLETQSYNTEEGQKALADAIEKANTEIINQKIAVEEAKQALQDLLQQQMKQVIEQEKNVAEIELEGKQEYDTKALEDYTKQQENAHNARIQSLDDELDALEKQNEEEEKSNELQEKRNDLKQKEMDLERLKGQQTIQTLQKQADGTYQFVYTYDKLAVEDKQKEVDEAKKELEDTRRKQEYEAEKQAIEDQKKSEEDLYKKKEDYLKKYADSLKEQQDLEKQRLDQYYSDMDKLSFNRLQELEQQYGQNWDEIAKTIQSKLSETESSFEQLTTIKLNFGTKAVQEALNSGDITTYLTNKRDQIDKSTKLDLQGIDSYIKSIDDSAQDLSETYDNILSIKDNNEITESDIKTRQVQANKVVNIDFDGLQKQIKNLQDANEKLEMELDSHYNKQLSRQKRAQQEELESLQKFSESYLTLSNKFLELLQVVYDYRFNNITTNVAGAVNEIVAGLNVISEAYESYAKAWNKMHPDDKIPSSIDTAQVQSDNSTYQKSVIDYQNSKLSLYNADVFEQYYKQIKNGITDNILTQLGNYSLPSGNSINTSNNSVVNNKNTTTSKTTQVTINQLDVNTKDAQSLLNQLLTLVENKTKLS
ncbi:hypothetical protein FHX84_004742, partial [Clostridium beijerinckii]|nr:hypothetical protein [Clostridium beijerinckii]